jgi:hypothetical protein
MAQSFDMPSFEGHWKGLLIRVQRVMNHCLEENVYSSHTHFMHPIFGVSAASENGSHALARARLVPIKQ